MPRQGISTQQFSVCSSIVSLTERRLWDKVVTNWREQVGVTRAGFPHNNFQSAVV